MILGLPNPDHSSSVFCSQLPGISEGDTEIANTERSAIERRGGNGSGANGHQNGERMMGNDA